MKPIDMSKMIVEEHRVYLEIISQKRPPDWGTPDETLYRQFFPISSKHRDSTDQETAAFDRYVKSLDNAGYVRGEDYKVVYSRHWAIGWVEELFVAAQSHAACKAAKRIYRRLSEQE